MTNKLPQESLAEYLAKYAGSFKVIGWTIEGLEHNITTDPKVCAEWHKMLFKVVPVYVSALDYSKGG